MADRVRACAIAVGLVLVAAFSVPEAAPIIGPLRVALLVDSSSAMAPMINPLRAALLSFLDNLPGDGNYLDLEVTIISTGGQLRVRIPATVERDKLKKVAAAFASDGGGNSFVDTMLEADKRFMRDTERRPVFVVVMTDNSAFRGEPRVDEYNVFARSFQGRGGRAHGIVIGGMNSGIHTDILMNLTSGTGGYYDSLTVPNALPDRLKYIAAMVAADVP